jgi:hypothetical protein
MMESPVKDPEKLLQDMDVNRLRAVIYRYEIFTIFLYIRFHHFRYYYEVKETSII